MTQTIAQNIIINNKAKYRKSNYGTHPIDTFSDLDLSINNNNTYNTIKLKLEKLETNYNNTIDELDILISNARQTYSKLKEEEQLLELLPTYSYTIPNKVTYELLLKSINTLIEDCNKIINNILNNTIDSKYKYDKFLIIEDISSNILAIVNKTWLSNYLSTIYKIPTIKKPNSFLIADNNGEIKWQ